MTNKVVLPSPQWAAMTTEERLRYLLEMSLDDIHEILSAPIDYRNHILMHAKESTTRAVLNTCVKLGIENRRRGEERKKVIADLTRKMRNGHASIDVLDQPIEERGR